MDKAMGIIFRPKYSRMCMGCPPNSEDSLQLEFLCGKYPNGDFLSIGKEYREGFSPYCDLTLPQTKALHDWLGECLEKFSA